jgi:hypothetical protein
MLIKIQKFQSFTVSGDFPVQNAEDARYWVGALHFLRSVTKMFFGKCPMAGQPTTDTAILMHTVITCLKMSRW